MSEHWINGLIGKPWESGKDGPFSFDCWGLCRFVQWEHYDRILPMVNVEAINLREVVKNIGGHPERARWYQVERPVDGGLVEMWRSENPDHIGIWVDVEGGGVLHCLQRLGVCFDSLTVLKMSKWRKINFYRCLDG